MQKSHSLFKEKTILFDNNCIIYCWFARCKNLGAYSISKTADIGLVNLAVELGKFNININGLCPGIIKTDFAREYGKTLRYSKMLKNKLL